MINNICIFLENEQRGFLTSLGIIFNSKYHANVTYVIKDSSLHKIMVQDSNKDKKIIDYSKLRSSTLNNKNIINEALRIEKTYNVNLNSLISENRGLGQGYLFNVQNVPEIEKSRFDYIYKYNEIINEIKNNEDIINGYDLVIQFYPNKLKTMVARKRGIKILSIAPIRYGDNHIWSNDDYLNNTIIINSIKKNLKDDNISKEIIFKPWAYSDDRLKKFQNFSVKQMLIAVFKILYMDTKRLLRNSRKKGSYRLYGWLPSVVRKVSNYKYVKSISVKPDDICTMEYIYFPLHLEPEIALLWFSPEFSNSMEIVSWISKSLPANAAIVIKEHGQSFSVRSRWYYKQLNKIANVYWADPDIHSWDWIKNSKAVATITGTVGIEAIYMNKPVISFGKHQLINYLPSTIYASNYWETEKAVKAFFSNGGINDNILLRSKHALHKTQTMDSFELVGYKNSYKKDQLDLKMANIAIKNLFASINSDK